MSSCGGEGDVKCQIEIRAGAGTRGTRRTSSQTSWASSPLGTMSRVLFGLDGGNSIGVQPVMVLGLGAPSCEPRRLFFFGKRTAGERETVTGRHHGSSNPRTSGARREAHDAPATMARHMQLEMTDIDLREVDGEFSDGEYTRARRLSTGACDLCNPETTRRLTSFTGITQAVWCARRWPLAKEACGDVYVSASGCAEGKDPARSTSSPPPSS